VSTHRLTFRLLLTCSIMSALLVASVEPGGLVPGGGGVTVWTIHDTVSMILSVLAIHDTVQTYYIRDTV